MIEIPFAPNVFQIGPVLLTWHGLFTLVGVLVAVFLAARWAPKAGLSSIVVYDAAIWVVLGGILGARLLHVVDQWELYKDNLLQVFAIYEGGIAIMGAILGGLAAGVIFTRIARYPTWKLADVVAPAVLIGMAIGRIGDIINGEHCALATSVSWGFVYTHPNSPAGYCYNSIPSPAMHPVVVYEMIWDLVVAGALYWGVRSRLRPDGMLFVGFLMLYALGRFFITFLRDDKVWFGGLQEAQLLSLVILAITVPLLAYRAQWGRPSVADEASRQPGPGPEGRRGRRGRS
ncbi:MAG: prolipoprotein diacylglyceryl transferase [Dehalococcoidia bacterium]|nr:prolipoprotein diacylglyceryl transferase [Dehalococcoidia bacterium]